MARPKIIFSPPSACGVAMANSFLILKRSANAKDETRPDIEQKSCSSSASGLEPCGMEREIRWKGGKGPCFMKMWRPKIQLNFSSSRCTTEYDCAMLRAERSAKKELPSNLPAYFHTVYYAAKRQLLLPITLKKV